MGCLVAFYLLISTKDIVPEGEDRIDMAAAIFFSSIWPIFLPFLVLEFMGYLISDMARRKK